LTGAFGRRRLADLRPEDLVKLYAVKRAERHADGEPTYSAWTVRYMHTTIRKASELAVEWGYVPINIATKVKAPTVPRPEVVFMEPGEVRRLLEAETERGHRLAELWTVAVGTGARSGELRGLLWKDVNLSLGTVGIRRTLEQVEDGRPIFKETKTPRSRRTIRISAETVAALRRQKDRRDFDRNLLGDAYDDSGLVFAAADGGALLDTSTAHAFKRALARAGLPTAYRVHDLRHAHATMLLKAGVHVKVVSERLCHASTAVTMDVYSHVLEGMDADAAERLEGILRAAM
jgi:integrase